MNITTILCALGGTVSSGRRRIAALAGIGLLVSTLAACSDGSPGGAGAAEAGEAPQEITMDLRNDIDTFDPMLTAADQGAVQMYEALYDTLVRRDMKSGDYIPAMASSWEITPTKIDFELKPGLTCSDGTALKPTDIAKSLERLADPKTGSIYTGRLFGAGGVKEIVADDAKDTVSVEVNDPHSDLIDGMTSAFIVCPKGLEDTEALATAPQGSGPYKLTSLKRGDAYVLDAWDSPALESPDEVPVQITMRVITADSTRANLFQTGATDIAAILGRDAERLLADNEPIRGKAFEADSLMFNQRDGLPMADEKLRRVIAQAIDGAAYTKAASFGVGEAVRTVITPNMDCYTKENAKVGLTYDLEQAKADLKDAGYGPGGKDLTIRLLGYDVQNSGPDYIADAIRKLGVKVDITNGTQAQAAGIVYDDNGAWDMIVFPFISAAPHPYPLVTKMSSNLGEGGSYNFGRTRNDTFDDLAAKAPGAVGGERCQLWGEAEAALLEDTNLVPLMWPITDYFTNGLTFEAGYRSIDLRTIRGAGK